MLDFWCQIEFTVSSTMLTRRRWTYVDMLQHSKYAEFRLSNITNRRTLTTLITQTRYWMPSPLLSNIQWTETKIQGMTGAVTNGCRLEAGDKPVSTLTSKHPRMRVLAASLIEFKWLLNTLRSKLYTVTRLSLWSQHLMRSDWEFHN